MAAGVRTEGLLEGKVYSPTIPSGAALDHESADLLRRLPFDANNAAISPQPPISVSRFVSVVASEPWE
jgi:hypothetical protein